MLTPDQVRAYRRDGYLVVENVLTSRELATLHQVIDTLVQASREVTDHNQIYDLEPTHSIQLVGRRSVIEPATPLVGFVVLGSASPVVGHLLGQKVFDRIRSTHVHRPNSCTHSRVGSDR